MHFSSPIAVLAVALALCAISTASRAEDCWAYPPGPQRVACASKNNPGFANELERCKQEARAMGLMPGAGGRHALEGYVEGCLQKRYGAGRKR